MKSNTLIKCDNDLEKNYQHLKPFFFCFLCNKILCYKCYPYHLTKENINHNENSIVPIDNIEMIVHNDILNGLEHLNKRLDEEDDKKSKNDFFQMIENIIQKVNNDSDNVIKKINDFKTKIIESIISKKKLFDYKSTIEHIKNKIKNFDKDDFSKEDLIKCNKYKAQIESINKEISNRLVITSQNTYFNNLKDNWNISIKKIEKYFEEEMKNLDIYIIQSHKLNISNENRLLNNKNNLNHNRDEFIQFKPSKKAKIEEKKDGLEKKASNDSNELLTLFHELNTNQKNNISKSIQNNNNEIILMDGKNNSIDNNSLIIENNKNENLNNNNNNISTRYFFSINSIEDSLGKIIIYDSIKATTTIYQITEEYFKTTEKYKIFPFLYSKGVNAKNNFYLTGGLNENTNQKLSFKISFNEELNRPEIEYFASLNCQRINHNILYLESKNMIIVCSGKNSLTCEGINLNNPKNWFLMPNLSNIRMNGTFFSIKDKYLYLIGGYNTRTESYVNGYEVLNIEENKNWEYYNCEIDFKISTMGVINFNDNKIYFVGGHTGGQSYSKKLIEVNIENNEIKFVNEKKSGLEKGIILYHSQVFCNIGKKYIGFDIHGNLIEYDIESQKFNIVNHNYRRL